MNIKSAEINLLKFDVKKRDRDGGASSLVVKASEYKSDGNKM